MKDGDSLYCYKPLGDSLSVGKEYIIDSVYNGYSLQREKTRIIRLLDDKALPITFDVDKGSEKFSRWLKTEKAHLRSKKIEKILNL